MKILVTGAKGFVGRNLIAHLRNIGYSEIYEYDLDTEESKLQEYTADCEFVFHLAGVNRPNNPDEYMEGNFGFTDQLLSALKRNHNTAPVMISSSIQAELSNPYGESKKAGEDLMFDYGKETGAEVLVYRFPNIFGKWCRPNYNSAVATFCYNIAHNLPISVSDPSRLMHLVYIDDVINELVGALSGQSHIKDGYAYVPCVHDVSLGRIPELLYSFRDMRKTLSVPDFTDPFVKKLYSTYLSYLPEDDFAYKLDMHIDGRGSFTEFLRTPERGQVSVNVSYPGITKGNHWHHTKNEKFLVIKGNAAINFRKVGDDRVITYHVNGEELTVVDIPCGYTHNIVNEGEDDLVTVMWANEAFDPEHPDTYYESV